MVNDFDSIPYVTETKLGVIRGKHTKTLNVFQAMQLAALYSTTFIFDMGGLVLDLFDAISHFPSYATTPKVDLISFFGAFKKCADDFKERDVAPSFYPRLSSLWRLLLR